MLELPFDKIILTTLALASIILGGAIGIALWFFFLMIHNLFRWFGSLLPIPIPNFYDFTLKFGPIIFVLFVFGTMLINSIIYERPFPFESLLSGSLLLAFCLLWRKEYKKGKEQKLKANII